MANTTFSQHVEGFDRLVQTMADVGENSARIVSEVFEDYAGPEIRREIQRLLPASGRRWRGKKTAARSTEPLFGQVRQEGTPVLYTRSKTRYNYLYFPDDGSNTRRHAGMQNFMGRGQDAATSRILDRCIAELTKDL